MRASNVSLIFFISGLAVLTAPGVGRAEADLDRLVVELTSNDASIAREARRKLEGMGVEVVPTLFERLLTADWTLKPRLLEVLSAPHGRDFAREKLLNGNETERVYAALVYELTRAGEQDDFDTPEFRRMVDALLEAIDSDDKYLRAAAGATLVSDDKGNVWFEHFHEIVPALIHSFDTALLIDRGHKPGPQDAPFLLICTVLDGLIGDRLAYHDLKQAIVEKMRLVTPNGARTQREREVALASAAQEIENLRRYWLEWWDKNSKLSASDIGRMIIDRNIRILESHTNDRRSSGPRWAAEWSLELWTGTEITSLEDWQSWWTAHRNTYDGPLGSP